MKRKLSNNKRTFKQIKALKKSRTSRYRRLCFFAGILIIIGLFAFGGYVIIQTMDEEIASEETEDEDKDEVNSDMIQIGKGAEQSNFDTKKEKNISSEDTFDYIAIGNSVTCNVIDETLWWGEWGMAATKPEKDYVHLITAWLEENSDQEVSSTVLNLKPWELAEDRSKVLKEYNDFFDKNIDLITIQTGENITENKENLDKDYLALISMIKEEAPNAQILVLGEVLWPSEDIEKAKHAACKEFDITFVDMTFFLNNYEAMYRSKIGTTVKGADGEEHQIENEVVAAHPNNKGMKFIAEEVIKYIQKPLETDTETATETDMETHEGISATTASMEREYQHSLTVPAGEIVTPGLVSGELAKRLFYSTEIDDELLSKIDGVSYTKNEYIDISELCYLKMLYYGIDGNTYVGEMIVNKKIADKVLEIFQTLYENKYPIEQMVLVDNYQANDEDSMSANNTSAFNFRKITGSNSLSIHSYGVAIDINPRYNPCVKPDSDGNIICQPENGKDYMDRNRDFPYKIDENDLAYKLFTEAGFTWGGSWDSLKDYQHFEMTE